MKLIILGQPVSVNAQYGSSRRGVYLKKKARAYKDAVSWQGLAQKPRKPLEGKLEVTYLYYFSDNRKRDHLNFNKLLNDGLNGIIWVDDSQICASHHYELKDTENPRIEITIKDYEKGDCNIS